jgi:predicted nucleotidyltransferase
MAPILTTDQLELVQCLNAHSVEYLIIGGSAVQFHGYPRATKDFDVFIAISENNAMRLVVALKAFFGQRNLPDTAPYLMNDNVVFFGIEPNRIEILTGISGVRFDECYPKRVEAVINGIRMPFISLADLRANKLASGRPKDLGDLDELPTP